MRRICLCLSFIAFLVTLAGCAATEPPFRHVEITPPPPGMAKLYFIREPTGTGHLSKTWPAILLNGRKVAPLPAGTYTYVTVPPGTYNVTMEKEQAMSESWTATATVDAQADRSHYLLLTLKYRIVEGLGYSLVMIGRVPLVLPEASQVTVGQGERWVPLDEAEGLAQLKVWPFVDPFVPAF